MENILTDSISHIPDIKISSKQVFGTEEDLKIPAFSNKTDLVPKIDKNYFFDNDTTISILTGLSNNTGLSCLKYFLLPLESIRPLCTFLISIIFILTESSFYFNIC